MRSRPLGADAKALRRARASALVRTSAVAPRRARASALVRTSAVALFLGPLGCGASHAHDASGAGGADGGAGDGAQQIRMGLGNDASPACQRVIDVSTDVTLSTPPPFDVVIVADNSDSLSWSHADLASGLQGLLTYVHGRDVRFFVLTTTQYGQSSQSAVNMASGKDLVTWASSSADAAYTDPVTDYTQTCTDPSGAAVACPSYPALVPVNIHGRWTFTMPAPIATITASMTDAEIAAQQQAISNAILGLVGGGASAEQPLCTLNRYIAQPIAALPKHAVFIVLSDEDDVTPPSDCLAGYDYVAQSTGVLENCSSDCSEYIFQMLAPAAVTTLSYSCVPEDDNGTLYPNLATHHTLDPPGGWSPSCAGPPTGTCSASQLTAAQNDCGSSALAQHCTYSCAVSPGVFGCNLTEASATDLCTQSFTSGGVTYADMADYCGKRSPGFAWSGCTTNGYDVVDGGMYGYEQIGTITPVVPAAATPNDMIAQFKAQASKAFAPGAYQVETIQLAPSFSCPVNPGQSYGTTLAALATTSHDVFPICQSYAGVLQHVQSFADGLVQTTYSVPVGSGETVEGVTVITNAGASRALGPEQFTYDSAAGTLTLIAGVLTSADASLHVDVGRDCVPR